MTAYDFLKELDEAVCHFRSPRGRNASNSELRRWLDEGAVLINNAYPKANEEISFPVVSTVMFRHPKTITIQMESWAYDALEENIRKRLYPNIIDIKEN